ncbi:MAG TPA: response regulator transcription factor [Thermoanaerobaculia bacterium]|jgi:DNA-binding NarL/FixJ family response regulator|nr:response regulator transcription factor [Thermoanaerobaculia bacterium]
MIRIAIADDHAIVRKGLRQIIADTSDLTVAAEAASADELLSLLRTQSFDVVVLDLTFGSRDGIDVLKAIKSEFPRLRVLILSMHAEDLFAVRALRAGASGYIQKESAPEELLTAIRRIAAGGAYVSAAMAERMAQEVVHGGGERLPHERLSDREFEVFRLLGGGKSVTEIAHALNLSVKTVSTHRARILEKTGLRTNADVVQYVQSHHLV